jgi:5-methyltetrahydropteroyltriglutamate--homocysteine methyltransferase
MLLSANLGYPRIGKQREWKFLLESYWKKEISLADFQQKIREQQKLILSKQKSAGVDTIPVGDFSHYDHVLDMSVLLGVIPARFQKESFSSPIDRYFAIARGTKENVASEMTKWFDTNYHYIVPELDAPLTDPYFGFLDQSLELAKEAGIESRPIVLGLMTYLLLCKKMTKGISEYVEQLLPRFIAIIDRIVEQGITSIQLDEPMLILERTPSELQILEKVISAIKQKYPQLNIMLQTYFESVKPNFQAIAELPVDGIGLDFVVNE